MPVKIPDIKEESMFKMLNIGVNIKIILFKNPLAFRMEIILEKITTKPPIIKIVEILLDMLFPKISPKFENETFLVTSYLEYDDRFEFEELFLHFQNLKIIPTVMHANI